MQTNTNVLIAGATGFIGVHLVNYLLLNSYTVTVLTRNKQTAIQDLNPLVRVEQWPYTDDEFSSWNGRHYDAIINLAGENIGAKKWSEAYKKKLRYSRVDAIRNLRQLVELFAKPPKVWIQASAIGFYGNKASECNDESAGKGSGFLADLVSVWEEKFSRIDFDGMRKVTMRLGVVLASSGGFLQQVKSPMNFGLAVCPGTGKQHLSFIHIDDLVRIIHQSMQDSRFEGLVNVVAPKAVTMSQLLEHFKKKQRLMSINIPQKLLNLLFGKEKTRELVLADQKIKPAFLEGVEYNFLHPTIFNI